MTVVHLAGRHTAERKAFLDYKKSHNSVLLTNSDKVETFEHPISVGDAYCDTFPATIPNFAKIEPSGFRLAPRSSAVIEVNESIEVPYNMFGIIFPKGTLATVNGIAVPTTKIDPGFRGNLRLLVSNTSSRSYDLKQGDVIASVVFLSTSLTVDEPVTSPKDDIVATVPPFRKRTLRWIKNHGPAVVVPLVSALVGGAFAIIAAIITLK